MPDSFYIGYVDRLPGPSRRLLRWLLPLLALLLLLSGYLLVTAQQFDASRFDFGNVQTFEGTFRSNPHPHLQESNGGILLLVGTGKHEADLSDVDGLGPGSGVRLKGTLIMRGETRMVEVVAGSAELTGDQVFQGLPVRLGPAQFDGEIVGSKCFLGVMNPAHGPVHAACARHCILGGVPPMLHPGGDRTNTPILISGLDRTTLARMAARPVTVSGTRWSLPGLEWVEVSSIDPVTP
ncbi:MAG: hypothetical protein HKN29_04210 [Rhodothermales bacterium]|nr:hypothetical protein [Rhodothermales bacterium]